MAKPQGFLPTTPDTVSCAWLTDAMRASGVCPATVRVDAVQFEPIGGGTGLAGDTSRVRFTWSDPDAAGLPQTAVAKFASPNATVRGLLESIDAYGREIAFYESLAGDMPMRVPRFYAGGADPGRSDQATRRVNAVVDRLPAKVQLAMTVDPTKLLRPSKRRYALFIEDLGDGVVVHDVIEPPGPEDLRLPLGELAKLHAEFWGRTDLAGHGAMGTLVTSTPRLYQNVYAGRIRDLMQDTWSWLTPEHLAVTDEANRRLPEDLATLNRGVTLVHGDPRTDNLLYSDDGADVTFVDWSLTAYAHPAYDVAYLLSSVLGPGSDPGAVDELGSFYLDSLRDAGRELDRNEFWSVARASIRAMLAQQVQAIPHPLQGYGDQRLEDLWVPRMLHTLASCPS